MIPQASRLEVLSLGWVGFSALHMLDTHYRAAAAALTAAPCLEHAQAEEGDSLTGFLFYKDIEHTLYRSLHALNALFISNLCNTWEEWMLSCTLVLVQTDIHGIS